MTMPPLVLITGATGHVGSAVLLHALRAGYTVRAAVRSESKAASVLARPQVQALNPGPRLSFAVVPDITAPGAYAAAAEDATHIIHIASPLATGDKIPPEQQYAHFVRPAVCGTLEMLQAASRSGTVRRVVITSSIVALVPFAELEGAVPRRAPVRPVDRVDPPTEPFDSEFAAYAASKAAALVHAEAWAARERPAFDIVHLHPSFVLGDNDGAAAPADALRGTNGLVLALLLGKRFGPYIGASVHVDDVARAHVRALNVAAVPGNQSYILSQPTRWNDAKGIVRRAFPAAVETRVLVARGNIGSVELPVDTSLTELVFGFRHISFEEQVKSVVGQFLELRSRNRPKAASSPASRASRGVLHQVRANA